MDSWNFLKDLYESIEKIIVVLEENDVLLVFIFIIIMISSVKGNKIKDIEIFICVWAFVNWVIVLDQSYEDNYNEVKGDQVVIYWVKTGDVVIVIVEIIGILCHTVIGIF